MKVREVKGIGTKRTTGKIKDTQGWFVENINKIGKPLGQPTKIK